MSDRVTFQFEQDGQVMIGFSAELDISWEDGAWRVAGGDDKFVWVGRHEDQFRAILDWVDKRYDSWPTYRVEDVSDE